MYLSQPTDRAEAAERQLRHITLRCGDVAALLLNRLLARFSSTLIVLHIVHPSGGVQTLRVEAVLKTRAHAMQPTEQELRWSQFLNFLLPEGWLPEGICLQAVINSPVQQRWQHLLELLQSLPLESRGWQRLTSGQLNIASLALLGIVPEQRLDSGALVFFQGPDDTFIALLDSLEDIVKAELKWAKTAEWRDPICDARTWVITTRGESEGER